MRPNFRVPAISSVEGSTARVANLMHPVANLIQAAALHIMDENAAF
jgi:hypothetical protein